MRRLLVTGASGFLGSRVVDFFGRSYEICAPGHGELDITDEEGVILKLQEWRPDYVIHCAAISDIGRCEKEPERSWAINVEGAVNMAKAAGQVGAKCLLCSSDQVYAGSKLRGPHREAEEVLPGNLYGREKLAAEERCIEVNPDSVSLRLSWMYDARTLHKEEHTDFMRMFLAKLKTPEILYYSAKDMRGITDVNEVVQNMEAAFALRGGVYNFGSPNEKSMFDTVHFLFVQMGWDIRRLAEDEKACAIPPRDLTMSQEKLREGNIFFTDTKERLLSVLKANV